MKTKLIYCLALVFTIVHTGISAQSDYTPSLPPVLPPSPQAAAFARYGEIPVSHSTGVPEISIPIYTIESGSIKLPLSISYHASGIKVQDVATSVGLGWVLNWGGAITRIVYDEPDATNYTNNTIHSVDHAQQLMLTNRNFVFWNAILSDLFIQQDTQSDRYLYNFNGKSGSFRYNSLTNAIIAIPYEPIKIQTTASGGFKIMDTDGIVYYFETQESSGPLQRVFYTSSWYISKIEVPGTNESIRFVYKTGTYYRQDFYSESIRKGLIWNVESQYGKSFSSSSPLESLDYTWSNVECIPKLIDSIVWNNHAIKMHYQSNRLDIAKDRLTKIEIIANGVLYKEFSFNNNAYFGSRPLNYRMKLEGLSVKGNQTAAEEKYSFVYNGRELPDYYDYFRIISNKVSTVCGEDYWGYYNGKQNQCQIPQEYTLVSRWGGDRNPQPVYMNACVLEEIKYPTGGSTAFEYEANRVYSDIVGGLRVKTITNKDNNNLILNRKTYEYSGYATVNMPISAEMFRYYYPAYFVLFLGSIPYASKATEWQVCVGNSMSSLTGWSSSPVFYSEVTEYNGTSTDNSGKTLYYYTEDKDDLGSYETDNSDFPRYYSPYYNCDQGTLRPLLQSVSIYERINNTYALKKSTYYNYKVVEKEPFICGVRLSKPYTRLCFGDGTGQDTTWPLQEYEYYNYIRAYNVYGFPSVRILNYVSEQEDGVTKTTYYGYDPNYKLLTPNKITTADSKGDSYTSKIKYPFDYTYAPYTDMVNRNMLSPVIEQSEYKGEAFLQKKITEYKNWGNNLLSPEFIKLQTTSQPNPEARITYHKYDSHGNPVYVSKDGAEKVVYLWAYYYQYPIAKIENASYDEVKAALSYTDAQIESLAAQSSPNVAEIDTKLRTYFNNKTALVTTYTYKPLVGILSAKDPRGVETIYEYDTFGRLKKSSHDGKVVEEYNYNYKQ
ncbi:MAG: hypothetical protein LBU22_02320 [Dysgonamonadaceae bacterium]|jgi:hypothetical protein|nr:hypothetical protein [Dysgonamonadaceae bacterium]